tara:strand:+ start:2007 stop:2819 length:813 start_codon:yes stop_codon:yes gene_type:complete
MASFSSLKTRFFDWMGIVDVTTLETSRAEEILNASVALVLSEGVPGLQQSMSGFTYGDLSVTISSHSAGSADVVFVTGSGNLTGVFPNDIFVAGGEEYIIHEVVDASAAGSSTTAINLGIPVTSALSGACTIKRRSLELPHNGQVITVADTNGNKLEYSPLTPAEGLYDSRRGAYTVSYSSKLAKSFITIYPTPTASTQYTIIQNRATADDSDFEVPDDQVYPVMMRAIGLWRMVNDEQNQVVAGLTQAAKDDASDLTRTNPGAQQIMVR